MRLFQLQDRLQAFHNRQRKRPTQAQGILLISSGGLGDTVLFSHVVEYFLALAKPCEPIVLLCNRGSEKMSFLFPPIIEFLSIDFQKLRHSLTYRRTTMASLFEANFRLVVHTDYLRHPDMDEALAKACNATETLAMKPRYLDKYSERISSNLRIYSRLYDSGLKKKNKIRRWLEFISWLTNERPELQTLVLPKHRIPSPITETNPLVIINPYSAMKEKQFLPSLFAEIISYIPQSYEIAITGTRLDRQKSPEFETLFKIPRVHFEESDFESLARKLQTADLVISVDTACMHLAVAVGAPTVCLASAAYVDEIVPYDRAWVPSHVDFIYKPMECEGCLGNCHLPLENGMYPCVAQLPSRIILDAIRGHLEKMPSYNCNAANLNQLN